MMKALHKNVGYTEKVYISGCRGKKVMIRTFYSVLSPGWDMRSLMLPPLTTLTRIGGSLFISYWRDSEVAVLP